MSHHFSPVDATRREALRAIVGPDNLSNAPADIEQHAADQSQHEAHNPEVVVWPTSAQQTADVLRYANAERIAVTPWGAGTSLEGNPIPVYGGILLSMVRLNAVRQIHADDFQVTVEPGLGYKDLNQHLTRYGLFFPPDPGANASIGGMLANNASGIRTVKYGASKDNVLRMQVALADGRLIEVGSRSVKQSSGYDLLHLFIGSEGTLGVITEATLKLWPVASHMSAVVATFNSVEAAIRAVVTLRGSGLDPAALEFLDAKSAAMLAREEGVDLVEKHTLFMEFHAAHEDMLDMGLAMARDLCVEMGAENVRSTSDPAERKKLWHARHIAFEVLVRTHPGHRFLVMDVAVPISAYPELVAEIQAVLARYEASGSMIGHAGDGNMHVALPYADAAAQEVGLAVNDAIVRKALALGGTASGEHGIGLGKRSYMLDEHGSALEVMRAMKRTFDPNGILNPGKIFPVE